MFYASPSASRHRDEKLRRCHRPRKSTRADSFSFRSRSIRAHAGEEGATRARRNRSRAMSRSRTAAVATRNWRSCLRTRLTSAAGRNGLKLLRVTPNRRAATRRSCTASGSGDRAVRAASKATLFRSRDSCRCANRLTWPSQARAGERKPLGTRRQRVRRPTARYPCQLQTEA